MMVTPGCERRSRRSGCEFLKQHAPAALERVAQRLGAVAQALKMAMLELDLGAAALGREADLDLGDERRIELPRAVDLPGEQNARRRLPSEHLAPLAFAAILAALEPAPAL